MENGTERLRAEDVRARMGAASRVGARIDCFDEIDSTNSYLKRIAFSGADDGTVAIAERQTMGRGRKGRSFESAAGKGLYLSVLLRPPLAPEELLPLTGLIAAAVCRAADRAGGVRTQIKWTNDIILNGRKLGGILTEPGLGAGGVEYVVAGIGLNVSQRTEDFTDEVAPIATSLARETGRTVSRAALAAALLEELDALYDALLRGDTAPYLADYRARCVTIGREVQLLWQDAREHVTALDVDGQFGLIVRRESGAVETIRTGEVSVRGLYGYIE